MSSGARLVHRGSFLGTGANIDIKVPGFRPKHVTVLNQGGLVKLEWYDTMGDGAGLKTITDGTISALTTTGITQLADGFRVGADTDVNVAGELCHYEAEE
jgi:hypothetical protein